MRSDAMSYVSLLVAAAAVGFSGGWMLATGATARESDLEKTAIDVGTLQGKVDALEKEHRRTDDRLFDHQLRIPTITASSDGCQLEVAWFPKDDAGVFHPPCNAMVDVCGCNDGVHARIGVIHCQERP